MRLLLSALLLCASGPVSLAAPAPVPRKPLPQAQVPMEIVIDFTSVAPQKQAYTFTLNIDYGIAKAMYNGSFEIGPNSTNAAIAALVYSGFPKMDPVSGQWAEGYDASIDASGLVVTVRQYRDGKGGTREPEGAKFGGGYAGFAPAVTCKKAGPAGAKGEKKE